MRRAVRIFSLTFVLLYAAVAFVAGDWTWVGMYSDCDTRRCEGSVQFSRLFFIWTILAAFGVAGVTFKDGAKR